MKNYRYFGDEMEVLGNRLDHARNMAATAKSAWAKTYWSSVLDRLLLQWRQLPILHDGDAQVTIIPRWDIKYNFFERSEEIAYYGIFDRLFETVYKSQPDLTASWERNRERRLAKAQ